MKVGGERLLIVPPSLGYGNRKMADIPANSTLRFGEPIDRYLRAFPELITSCQRSSLSARSECATRVPFANLVHVCANLHCG
jgi:hypothetical protein